MLRKPKPPMPRSAVAKDLWINPRSNIKGPDGNRAWDNEGNISPNSGARFLELADIALGLKKPTLKKKKAAAAGAHQTIEKNEPYSS
jgi:hypothetical protein